MTGGNPGNGVGLPAGFRHQSHASWHCCPWSAPTGPAFLSDPDPGRSFRWYRGTPREILSTVLGRTLWWVAGLLVAVVLSSIGLCTFNREDVGDPDAAAAVCEKYVRSQPNVPASATLDFDIEAGGDDFVIVGFVLGEGLLADGIPAERVPTFGPCRAPKWALAGSRLG
jgi:hypothetical protein